MNYIDGYVEEVLSYEIKKNSEMWELDKDEVDQINHIYKVKYLDEGGEHETDLWFDKPNNEVKKGYVFLH